MKIYNATPHAINIVVNSVFNPAIRKYTVPAGINAEIVTSIPSSGMLSAKVNTVNAEPINNIPVFSKQFAGVDEPPAGYDIYVVSALYASAARATGADTSKLYTVADPVYSEDGRTILGSRGICPFI